VNSASPVLLLVGDATDFDKEEVFDFSEGKNISEH
jgi:hypothetical protein